MGRMQIARKSRKTRASRILIVEDELFVAFDLEALVHQHDPAAEILVCTTVAEAYDALAEPVTLALLDVDVLDGKTFEVAAAPKAKQVPFVFISGSRADAFPAHLTDVPFVPKPFAAPVVQQALQHMSDRI